MNDEHKQYLADLSREAPDDHPIHHVLRSTSRVQGRLFHTGLSGTGHSIDRVLQIQQQQENDVASSRNAVCVIENISPESIATLGVAWQIPPSFFISYASNTTGEDLWESVMHAKVRKRLLDSSFSIVEAAKRYVDPADLKEVHLEGMVLHLKPAEQQIPPNRFPRRYSVHPGYYGIHANTRMSYYRVTPRLYLFLVDPPLAMATDERHLWPSRLCLLVPCSRNRGGLPIPQLYSQPHFSLFEALQNLMAHTWHYNFLFHDREAINGISFSYLLSVCIWRTNMGYLDNDIKRIAFQDIRRPSVRINDRLHDRRHDLDTLQYQVTLAIDWLQPEVDQFHDQLWQRQDEGASFLGKPSERLSEVLQDAKALERFLMDTLQLLMSSISVLDSQTSIQQARRGSHLTILATIYVPLAFVTGIYGMNIQQINQSGHQIWVFIVTLLIVGLCTVGLLWAVGSLEDERAKYKARKHSRVEGTS